MACPSALRVGLSLATPALPATPRLAAPRQSKARSSIRLPAASEWPRTGAGKRGNARVGGGGSCAPFKRGTQCQRACSRACSLGAHDAARTRTGTRVRRATRTSAPAAARTGLIPRPTTASHGARVRVAFWVGTGHDVLAGSRSRVQADKHTKHPPAVPHLRAAATRVGTCLGQPAPRATPLLAASPVRRATYWRGAAASVLAPSRRHAA